MKTSKSLLRILSALALVGTLALSAGTGRAAVITIVNNDGAGEGFNDATVVAPVGGNPGTTIGAQRLFVFQTAANIWGSLLPSAITIQVRSQFNPLTCTPTSATLGSAGTTTAHGNFPGAIFLNTWYHQSLANRLSSSDLDATNPDINATFNSALDGGTCLGGLVWYYGIDGLEGVNVELLPVVLHEMGHGLGFSTLTNGNTGAYFSGFPSTWDWFLYDNATGLNWVSETAAQRGVSGKAVDKLAWNGPGGIYGATHFLGYRPRMQVNSPGGIAGTYVANAASFGAALTVGGVTGNVVLMEDGLAPINDGCEALTNGPALFGKIALVDRGLCGFVIKAGAAQAAGAIGLIIANNVAGALSPGGTDPSITIPVVGISQADGATLKANLGSGVNVTLGLNPAQLAGADASSRPLMYTPAAFASGSSVSHFDISASPNALMEPNINQDLHTNVDMTYGVMSDIGWLSLSTATTLAMFDAQDDATGVRVTWQFTDPGDVGAVTIERATAEAGPWSPISTEFVSENGRTLALDPNVQDGMTYYYRLKVMDRAGATTTRGLASVRHTVYSGPAVLFAPQPNPAERGTSVTFRISQPEFVRLQVVDATGRRVATVHEGMLPPGEHVSRWDGRGEGSREVPAGLYFLTLKTSTGFTSQRIAVVH